jgi:hypothetical protein
MKYLNIKTTYGIETIDQLDSKEYKTFKDFKKELIRLKNEYNLAYGGGVYVSTRSTKDWVRR